MTLGLGNLEQALQRFVEAGIESGRASAGTNTTLTDVTKDWPVNRWAGGGYAVHIIRAATGIEYVRLISANTATQITFAALPGALAPAVGDIYAIRESESITALLNKLIPIAKANVFNAALPAAEADILGAAIVPTNSPSYLRIYVCMSVAGIFRITRTVGVNTVIENMREGAPLVAGAGYMFTIPWRTTQSINFRYSVTGGNINALIADEIGGAE